MKTKKLFAIVMMAFMPLVNVSVSVASEVVPLEIGFDDPFDTQDDPNRSPETVPEVSIDGYTLTFLTPCNGYELRLLDEYGIEVYSTVITSSTLQLPTWLSGDYELQIIPTGSNYYFTGTISL